MTKKKAAKPKIVEAPFDVPDWPAMKPVMRPLSQIHEYPNNARTHPPAQIEMLASLMKSHGVDQPIAVDDEGVILKGHGRKMAALLAGFEEFPVVVHRGLSDEDKRAMRLQDNQVALLSGWNQSLIRGEITSLKTTGYNLQLLGFEPGQLLAYSLVDVVNGSNNPNAEWSGMPEFDQVDKTAFRSIVIHFKDQKAVDKFAAQIKLKVTPNTRQLWFPEIEIETYVDKRYKA
jgi:hypothetical protein